MSATPRDTDATAFAYEAFGRVRGATGAGPVVGKRFTYTGREPLGDTQGLYYYYYYYRWRVMDPNAGRFTSEGLLGFVDGVSRQNYAPLDPRYFIDVFALSVASSPISATSIPLGFWNVIGSSFLLRLRGYLLARASASMLLTPLQRLAGCPACLRVPMSLETTGYRDCHRKTHAFSVGHV